MKPYIIPKKILFLFLFIIIFLAFFPPLMTAVEPTQQFNKLFLSPFYVQQTTQNIATNFTISVNPPDKINQVLSAIIIFDVWLNPSVNFTLKINGISCNNPSYYISTTYASAGKNTINFDCSNVINKAGIYLVQLTASKDTGAMTGWLDLTYINNPKGSVDIFGTEYSPNDNATIFVQLKNAEGLAIENGSCFLNMWYPANASLIHPHTIQNAPMLKALGGNGIYYYDMTAPSQLGVYMLSAECSYAYGVFWNTKPSLRGIYYGAFIPNGLTDTDMLLAYDDALYQKCTSVSSGGNRICDSYYVFNLSDYVSQNITRVNVHYAGESSGNPFVYMYIYNFSTLTWYQLPNSVSLQSVASTSAPVGVDEFFSNTYAGGDLKTNFIANATATYPNTLWVRILATSGATHTTWDNWINVNVLTTYGTIQDVKGSSEMHITNIPQATANLISNLTININNSLLAQAIWNYSNRQLTNFVFDVVNETEIAGAVWTFGGGRNLTGNVSLEGLANINISAIWDFQNKSVSEIKDLSVTFIGQTEYEPNENGKITIRLVRGSGTSSSLETGANCSVSILYPNQSYFKNQSQMIEFGQGIYYYNFVTPNILGVYTYFTDCAITGRNYYSLNTFHISDLNETAISENIWQYQNRSLTYYEVNNISVGQIWGFVNRSLTYYEVNNITASDIWLYNNRSLSYYPTQIDLTNYTLIYNLVQNLTQNVSYSVWTYYNKTLDYYPLVNLSEIPALVWQYSGERNLTYYEDKTNYTNIAYSVWNWAGGISNSILDFFANSTWNFAQRVLTFYEDTTNYSKVAQYVWEYQNGRNLTYYVVNDISPEDIWQYTSRNLSFTEDVVNYSRIAYETANLTWVWVDRNLTTYPIGNNITASEIWEYYNRSLSQDIPMQIWNYPERNLTTDIPFEVWSYWNRTLTFYTINLTELIEMINEYDFDEMGIPLIQPTQDVYGSDTLNVILYIQK